MPSSAQISAWADLALFSFPRKVRKIPNLSGSEDEKHEEVIFNIRVLSYCKSSFERRILESVTIQKERHHHLLYSKAEYNRSAVPRLTTKIGEKQYKKWEKEAEKDIEKHEELEEKIRNMSKQRNKGMRNPV